MMLWYGGEGVPPTRRQQQQFQFSYLNEAIKLKGRQIEWITLSLSRSFLFPLGTSVKIKKIIGPCFITTNNEANS
jgi:hypothetical protein